MKTSVFLLVFAALSTTAFNCCFAQVSGTTYYDADVQTSLGYSNNTQTQGAQSSISYTHTDSDNNGHGITASITNAASVAISSNSLTASINLQTATTNSSGGATALENSEVEIYFQLTQPFYYSCTCSASYSGNQSTNSGWAILKNGQTGGNVFYMGVGADEYGPPTYTAPGTATGILQSGSYTLVAGALCEGRTGGMVTSGSANNTTTFHLTPLSVPTVTTADATKITPTTATLNGSINPNGIPTSAYFEYWVGNLPHNTVSIALNPTDSSTAQPVSGLLSGLVPGSAYQWQLVATNAAGTTTATGKTFLTPNLSTIQFDSANYSVHENVGIATIVVDRLGGSTGQVSVFCQITDGTATEPSYFSVDRSSYTQTLTWADGDTQPKFLDLDVVDWKIRDGSYRTATLTLTDPSANAQIGSPSQTLFAIFYDDPPVLSASPEVIPNPNTSGSYKVMNLLGVGAPNANYTIQSSPDLSPNSFTNLTTVTTDGSGNFQYLDPILVPQKFYRIVYPNSFPTNGTNQLKSNGAGVNRRTLKRRVP